MIRWSCRVALERARIGVARRLGLNVDLLDTATSVDELCCAEDVQGPSCIVLPGQYERVRACAFGVDKVKEIAELRGAPRRIGPTIRYELEDVIVSDGIVYGQGKRKIFNYQLDSDCVKSPWVTFEEAALRSSFLGSYFFGHWLRDDCATHLLAEDSKVTVAMPTPPWPDRASYLELFRQSFVRLGRAHIRRLVLYDDISQNAHKAGRFRTLRARIARKTRTGRIVYLMRGSGGKQRTLVNEKEVVDALARRGVAVLQAEALSAHQLVSELLGSRIVISIEGSQLSHALYTLRDGGGVLAIQPPDRFFNSHMDWARALNMRYGIVVGQQQGSGFELPVDDLLRTIDLMDAEIR